jgi:hypothetical protein
MRSVSDLDEERPTIALTPEQIAHLESEKAALLDRGLSRLKSDARRVAGHGTALEDLPEPRSSKRKAVPVEPAPAIEPAILSCGG